MLKQDYKNWIPNIYGRRYTVTQDGSYTKITDATTYQQTGDNVGANDINAQNTAINNACGDGYLDYKSSLTEINTSYPPSATYLNKKCIATDTNTIYKCVLKGTSYTWVSDGGGGVEGKKIDSTGATTSTYEVANEYVVDKNYDDTSYAYPNGATVYRA